jgi:hypothetical protein
VASVARSCSADHVPEIEDAESHLFAFGVHLIGGSLSVCLTLRLRWESFIPGLIRGKEIINPVNKSQIRH